MLTDDLALFLLGYRRDDKIFRALESPARLVSDGFGNPLLDWLIKVH